MENTTFFDIANLSSNATGSSTNKFLSCIREDAMNPLCDRYADQQPFKLTAGRIVSAIGIAILIVIALAGNVLVCAAFCHYKRLRTVPNYFIVSLAVSDIMVAGLSMPLWISYEVTEWQNLPLWVDDLALEHFWECIDMLAAISSIANLTAISLDRFFGIVAPLRHRTRMTPLVALMMIAFAWSYALIISLCYLIKKRDYTAVAASFGFFIPLLIILLSYFGIYIKFRMRSMRQENFEADWNLEKTLLIVVGLFIICWLPFFVVAFLHAYCFSCNLSGQTVDHLRGFVKWMHYLNSCCNPIVYGFCNVNFKTAFWALLGKCFSTTRYSDMDLGPSRDTSNSQAGTLLRHLKSMKRKLSWKRDLDDSMVSNGSPEVNENSVSLALLALHLKGGKHSDIQESRNLLNVSDSRPSSKVSEDMGLLANDQNSFQGFSNEETMSKESREVGSFADLMAREVTNKPFGRASGDLRGPDDSNLYHLKNEANQTSVSLEATPTICKKDAVDRSVNSLDLESAMITTVHRDATVRSGTNILQPRNLIEAGDIIDNKESVV